MKAILPVPVLTRVEIMRRLVSHSHLLSTSFKSPVRFFCKLVTFGFASLVSHPSSPLNSLCMTEIRLSHSFLLLSFSALVTQLIHLGKITFLYGFNASTQLKIDMFVGDFG